jgi:hypothetical protein
MATTVEGLFNLPTAAQAGQQYLEGMMSSPAQMNQLSLLQQAAATGRNAGAMVGYGAGRLLGGKAPDEVRIEGVNQAMAEATQMGGTDAEMYANLAKGLAARGLTQDAMAATERARTAKRDEQAMTLAASQEARAVKGDVRADEELALRRLEEERRVIAAQQAKAEYDQRMKIYPLDIQEKELALRKREQDLNGAMGELTITQETLAKGINPQTGEPLTAEDKRALRARLAQATLAINNEATKLANERAEHEAKMKSYEASRAASEATRAAASASEKGAFTKDAFVQVPPEVPYPGAALIKIYVGDKNPKTGQVIGKNGRIYSNENEAALAQGLVSNAAALAAPAAAPAAPAAPAAAPANAPAAPAKKPVKPLSAF